LLTGIDKEGVKASLYYLPLIAVLLPMIVGAVDLSNTGLVPATLLFTLGVGIAEELYLRGIILRILGKSFGPLPVVFNSVPIFGTSHAEGAFVQSSLIIVVPFDIECVLVPLGRRRNGAVHKEHSSADDVPLLV
jgi:membrane protease YdiL (CAAX protease family)